MDKAFFQEANKTIIRKHLQESSKLLPNFIEERIILEDEYLMGLNANCCVYKDSCSPKVWFSPKGW